MQATAVVQLGQLSVRNFLSCCSRWMACSFHQQISSSSSVLRWSTLLPFANHGRCFSGVRAIHFDCAVDGWTESSCTKWSCQRHCFEPPLFFTTLRHYGYRSSKSSQKGSGAAQEEDEDEEDAADADDAVDDLSEMSTITFKEDSNFPSSYKEMKIHLKSSRLDAIVSAGLGISRSKVDDIFLDSKLRHNGDRVLKKSKQLKEGDYIDMLLPAEEGATRVKRVRVVKIVETEGSANNRLKVLIRSWRSPVSI